MVFLFSEVEVFTYKAQIINVVDGDTVDVDIDLGFNVWVRDVRLRLNRINAYETKLYKGVTEEERDKGLQAKEFVKSAAESGKNIVVTTIGQGKYGRWIAELVIDDININDELVNLGLAIYQQY